MEKRKFVDALFEIQINVYNRGSVGLPIDMDARARARENIRTGFERVWDTVIQFVPQYASLSLEEVLAKAYRQGQKSLSAPNGQQPENRQRILMLNHAYYLVHPTDRR